MDMEYQNVHLWYRALYKEEVTALLQREAASDTGNGLEEGVLKALYGVGKGRGFEGQWEG